MTIHLLYQFSYLGILCGGAKGDRTPDLLRAKQALSQLSYGPFFIVVPEAGLEPARVLILMGF